MATEKKKIKRLTNLLSTRHKLNVIKTKIKNEIQNMTNNLEMSKQYVNASETEVQRLDKQLDKLKLQMKLSPIGKEEFPITLSNELESNVKNLRSSIDSTKNGIPTLEKELLSMKKDLHKSEKQSKTIDRSVEKVKKSLISTRDPNKQQSAKPWKQAKPVNTIEKQMLESCDQLDDLEMQRNALMQSTSNPNKNEVEMLNQQIKKTLDKIEITEKKMMFRASHKKAHVKRKGPPTPPPKPPGLK